MTEKRGNLGKGENMTRDEIIQAVKEGANLREAYLGGAYLGGAYLGGDQWIVQGSCRSDGYWFFFQKLTDAEPMVKAGCRYFTLIQARDHWQKTRVRTPLGNETFAILDCMEAQAKARGLI